MKDKLAKQVELIEESLRPQILKLRESLKEELDEYEQFN